MVQFTGPEKPKTAQQVTTLSESDRLFLSRDQRLITPIIIEFVIVVIIYLSALNILVV